MAQRDIEAIAEAMRAEEADRAACDEAYEKAKEAEKLFEKEEFEELEDEIISPASMGFVDSENIADESDDFYNEDFREINFDEDVSDCIKEKDTFDEAENNASIEVDVYNEDGYGAHFASEVMKNVPGVTAKAGKMTKPNGDIVVKMSGSRQDLQRAFAFYLGQKSYAALPQEDKEEFESLLVFDEGDTLAEADYREAVAHCLDPVVVNASTADLVDQDTCAINLIREERAKRSANKMLKALCEQDMSDLSDKELDQLEGIQDALASGEGEDGMTDEELKVWKTLLKTMGYTLEQWNSMTPEQQKKAWDWDVEKSKQSSKSGFARWHTVIDPHDWRNRKRVDYEFPVPDPDDPEGRKGFVGRTQFNPDYTSEISPHQHPHTYDKDERRAAAQADKDAVERRRQEFAKNAQLHSRSGEDSKTGRPAITQGDFGRMLAASTDEEIEDLKNSMIEYVKSTAKSSEDLNNELKVINSIFSGAKNKKTLIDLGNTLTGGGHGAPAIKKFVDDFDIAMSVATRKASGKDGSRESFMKLINSPAGRARYIKVLANVLNSRKTGKNPIDPERVGKRQDWMKMLRDLGYNPVRWDQLTTDQQLELMDQYYAKQEQK